MTDRPHIRIGARGSNLSRQQAGSVRDRLEQAYPDRSFAIAIIETQGDRTLDRPLPEIGGKGIFTLEIEEALRAGRVDLAVHSLKDLPVEPAPGIVIGAIPERASVSDALISRSGARLHDLPEDAAIGTSSHRRATQLRRIRPDLRPESIRGNVESRIRKTRDPAGPYDACVVASAGLERLGLLAEAVEVLPLELMLPAPGQAALAVQCRDERVWRDFLWSIDDRAARLATSAERAFLAGLGGGCSAPIACYGTLTGNRLYLHGRIVALDASGQIDVTVEQEIADAAGAIETGARLAAEALANGAAAILRMAIA